MSFPTLFGPSKRLIKSVLVYKLNYVDPLRPHIKDPNPMEYSTVDLAANAVSRLMKIRHDVKQVTIYSYEKIAF